MALNVDENDQEKTFKENYFHAKLKVRFLLFKFCENNNILNSFRQY